jgi:hypothetical protein
MKGYMTFPNTGSNVVSFFTANFASKLYLDSIKEIIYCYDNLVCCSQKKTKIPALSHIIFILDII